MTERPTILVDTREQRPLRFSADVDVEVVGLETGDYSVRGFTDVVRFERKAPGDLWMCCGHERARFEAELARLRAYPVRAVVVEATIQEILATMPRGRVKAETVVRSTISWQQDFGCPFVWCGDPRTAAAWVERALTRVVRKGQEKAA